MQRGSILIIDSDTAIVDLVARVAKEAGCRVETCAEGREALSVWDRTGFDVVITEVDLEDMDGLEVLQRGRGGDPATVPIVMTARRDHEIVVRALESGARSYLQKPFDEEDVRLRLQKALRERKRLVERRLLLGDLMTDRSNLQQKVAERERFLNDLIDAAPFGIISTDVDGSVLTFNGTAERLYGYLGSDIEGKSLSVLLGDDVRASVDSSPITQAEHVRKDGSTFPVLIHSREILNGLKRSVGRLYVVEDLTEKEAMRDQLLSAERLSVLGQLAPRIAHELKTPLQIVSGSYELSRQSIDSGELDVATKWLDRAPGAIQQVLDLVERMSNLGKPEKSCVQSLDLSCVIDNLIETLTPLGILKYVEVETRLKSDIPTIEGDRGEMEQVFRNLVVNALHAMERSRDGMLTVEVDTIEEGRFLQVRVSDTGTGISDEHVQRIFEPFFTTKESGKGTGLGLPIVKSIVDRHGGAITIETEVDQGTTFIVTLPATSSDHADPSNSISCPSNRSKMIAS